MKHSIRFRLILILTILIVSTIFMYWFVNMSLLPTVYEISKIESLGKMYDDLNKMFQEVTGTEQEIEEDNISLSFEKVSADKNISLYVFSLIRFSNPFGTEYIPQFIYPTYLGKDQREQVVRQTENYLSMEESSIINQNTGKQNDVGVQAKQKFLQETDNYKILKIYDERIGSYYLELFGKISLNDNDYNIYMRTNYESIQESVTISNTFMAYVGIIATLLGIIVMFFIGNNFTKPIRELSGIAKEMSNLNFEKKYLINRKDEIGDLGSSINRLSEKLEETISELKTANNELKKDIENKIQIDEMRKEFLSNVSHELKTPIALIQGYAEGLNENINDDQASREFYCEVIIDEANRMNKMVKKLLSLNQIEFGNEQVQFERFDIVSLIRSVLSSTEILFQQKEARLIFEQYESIYVWADEYMIEEVITNYISNALNHVDGERVIEIKLEHNMDIVRISVFNTGQCIPEEDLEKVWIKFYKVDKARTREYGGSGIGLSIVKAIMTSLNRECGVINHDNGVEFWLELDVKNK